MSPSQQPSELTPAKAPPTSLELAETRTSLALKRSYFAAERTLMAWVRTSLSMISFGFTMVKFFQFVESSRGPMVGLFGRTWAPSTVGLALMSIGIFALAGAVYQHRQSLRDLQEEGLQPTWSLALTVAGLLAVLGLFGLGSLFAGR